MKTENGRKLLSTEEIAARRWDEITQHAEESEHMASIAKYVYLAKNKSAPIEDLVGPIMVTVTYCKNDTAQAFNICTSVTREDVIAFKADKFYMWA